MDDNAKSVLSKICFKLSALQNTIAVLLTEMLLTFLCLGWRPTTKTCAQLERVLTASLCMNKSE